MALAGLSGIGALGAVVATISNTRRFDPTSKDEEYYAEASSILPVEGQPPVTLDALHPGEVDRARGFFAVTPLGSSEVAHTSALLNAWLSTQPRIEIDLPYGAKNRFSPRFHSDPQLFERHAYLRSLVRSKKARNEQKYRLSDITVGQQSVTLEKVGYFDALMSNQLVTSQIMRRPAGTDQAGIATFDMRGLYPISTEFDGAGKPRWCLSELREDRLLANSVGVTTLALSRDRFPLIFNQKNQNIEGSGTLTLAGSGSADFADIKHVPRNLLLDTVKTGMIRELFEEARLDVPSHALAALRRDAMEKTYVTGFFRWIRRGGKPEFLGVTKLDINLANIRADNIEVAPLLAAKNLRSARMSDFTRMAESLIQSDVHGVNMQISLSSAMAIWRMSDIATDTSPEGMKLRKKIAAVLDIAQD